MEPWTLSLFHCFHQENLEEECLPKAYDHKLNQQIDYVAGK